jgi:mono/diheme cytochrome c family protein
MKHIPLSVFLMILILSSAATAQSSGPEAIYKTKCAMCHGPDGSAKTPMAQKLGIKSFQSPEIQNQSDAELKRAIAQGKNKMPAFGKSLTEEQIAGLLKHIRELGKK